MSSDSTSVSLIDRVRRFDADAWQRLCDIYGPAVYRWARNAGLQDDDAADIGQEVFRTVAARIGEFRRERNGDTFRGWLWTITRNKLGDYLRKVAANPQAKGGSAAIERMHEVPELPVDESSDSAVDVETLFLHRALQLIRVEFEESTWQAFWRATVDGHPTDTIADDLGMTRQAVRQAKYRILRRLRSELSDDLS